MPGTRASPRASARSARGAAPGRQRPPAALRHRQLGRRERGERREEVGHAADGRLQAFAVRSCEAGGQRRRARERHLLAQHRARSELARVGAARHAASRRGAHLLADQRVAAELLGDRRGVGVEIEQPAAELDRGRLVALVVEPERAVDVTGLRAAARRLPRHGTAAGCAGRRRPPAPPRPQRRGARRSRAAPGRRTAGGSSGDASLLNRRGRQRLQARRPASRAASVLG